MAIAREIKTIKEVSELVKKIGFIGAVNPEIITFDGKKVQARLEKGFATASVAAAVLDQIGSLAVWAHSGIRRMHATLNITLSFLEVLEAPIILTGEAIAIKKDVAHIDICAHQESTQALIMHGFANYILDRAPGGGEDGSLSQFDLPTQQSVEPIALAPGQSFEDWLGLKQNSEGMELHFSKHLIGLPQPITLHGGVIIASLLLAAQHHVKDEAGLVLRNISIEYLRAGKGETTQFNITNLRAGRQSYTVRVDGFQKNGARHIASAFVGFTR